MKTEASVEIDRPIEEVFDKAFECVPAWSTIVVEAQPIEETPEVVGSTFKTITEDRGRRMEFLGIVTEYQRPQRSRVEMVNKAFDLDVLYLFEATATGTRMTQMSEVKPKGITKVIMALVGLAMRKSSCEAQQKELNGLKAFCESGASA